MRRVTTKAPRTPRRPFGSGRRRDVSMREFTIPFGGIEKKGPLGDLGALAVRIFPLES
jgi:hypothetical protein